MNDAEKRAVLSACWMAAFADGAKVEPEREEIGRLAKGLVASGTGFTDDVLLARKTPAQLARELESDEARRLAYEMAVCVCDADGTQTAAEKLFLGELRSAL